MSGSYKEGEYEFLHPNKYFPYKTERKMNIFFLH